MIWPFVILAAVLLLFIHDVLDRMDKLERRVKELASLGPSHRPPG